MHPNQRVMRYLITLLILSQSLAKEGSNQSNLRKAKNDNDTLENDEAEIKNRNRRLGLVKATAVGVNRKNGISAFSTCVRENDLLAKRDNIQKTQNGPYSIINLEGISFAEKFEGLEQDSATGIIGLEDYLHGEPIKPLTLSTNHNHREDLWVEREFTKINVFKNGKKEKKKQFHLNIMGRGLGGFAGLGAVAILFDKDKHTIDLKFWSDGSSTAVTVFYDKNGRYLGRLDVDLELTNEYLFTHDKGKIRGLAFWSTGEVLEWHKIGLIGLCHE